MKRNTIIEIISTLFILLFVYTATSKLFTIEKFKVALAAFPTIGAYATAIAYAVPITELAISALLVAPRFRKSGLYLSLGLMTFFTLYLGYMVTMTSDHERPCECGGVITLMSWTQHLIFNIIFTGLAALGVILMRKKPDPNNNKPIHPALAS